MSDSIASPNARKRTQRLVTLGIVGIVFVTVLVSVMMVESRDQGKPIQVATPATTKSIAAPGTIDAKEAWITQSAAKLGKVDESTKELQEKASILTDTQKQLAERMAKLEQASTLAASSVPVAKPLNSPSERLPARSQSTGNLPPPPPPSLAREEVEPARIIKPTAVPIVRGDMGEAPSQSEGKGKKDEPVQSKAKTKKKTVTNYIPSGTFASAYILGGINAPTGGTSQTNPQPVLLEIADNAFLPNDYRFQVKRCRAVGAGFGDISSERANIRLESLSCILDDGTTIDVSVTGYVSGEDGMAGVKGKLITKQGKVLLNALIAGVGSGIGQAFTQNAMTTQVSAFGTTAQVPAPGQAFQSGLSTGVGKAMDRLANYYISLADKLFPVIEVGANRKVDIVFTKGVTFESEANPTGETTWADVARDARIERNRSLNFN